MRTHNTSTIEKHLEQIERACKMYIGHKQVRVVAGYIDLIRTELTAQAKQTEHEGWTNYETWLVAELFKYIKITHGAYSLIEELSGLDNMRIESKANMVRSYINDNYIRTGNPLQHKLTKSAIDRIDFTQIAEKLIAEAKTQSQEVK